VKLLVSNRVRWAGFALSSDSEQSVFRELLRILGEQFKNYLLQQSPLPIRADFACVDLNFIRGIA